MRNLFTEETRLVVDIGFSQTARPGAVMATRLLDFGGFIATGGAALPLGILDNDELDRLQRELRAGADDERSDPAPLARHRTSATKERTPNVDPLLGDVP